MENLLGATAPKGDQLLLYWGDRRVGWFAVSDIAAMAAANLYWGPEKQHGRDYWIITDVLDGSEVAAILSEVTGRDIGFTPRGPDDFRAALNS
jgi:NAD(P)H dehydrogenase (quinone)